MLLAFSGAISSPHSERASIPISYFTPQYLATSPNSVASINTLAKIVWEIPPFNRFTFQPSGIFSAETKAVSYQTERLFSAEAIFFNKLLPTDGSNKVLLTHPVCMAEALP